MRRRCIPLGQTKNWVYVSIILSADEVIKDKLSNLVMSDDLISEILDKGKSWLIHEFPNCHAEYDIFLHILESKILEILRRTNKNTLEI